MDLTIKLEELKRLYFEKSDEFEKYFSELYDAYPDKRDEIDTYMKGVIDESIKNVDNFIADVKIKIQLAEVSKMVSLSYIAKEYFNKSRYWLYQKINGNKKNGKPAKFSPEEIDKLNFALQDISKKIGSTFVRIV